MPNPPPDPMLTVKEVGAILRISARTVHRHIVSRKLNAVMIGREWRIRREDLETYMKIGTRPFLPEGEPEGEPTESEL